MIDIKLLKNIAYLGSIQGLSFILPLATVPLLISKLGIEQYGDYAFTLAIVQYLIIIVDYGYSLSATKMIALNRDNINKVNIIFWCVITSKFLIFLLVFASVAASSILFDVDSIYLIASISVLGSVLFPVWLFQAKEMMATLAIFNVIGRMISLVILVITMEYDPSLNNALYINSLTALLPSLLSIYFLYNKRIISDYTLDKNTIFYLVREGGQIFISNLMSTLYTNSVLVFIGLYYSNAVVGAFSAADKVRVAVQALITPVSQALYPRMSIALSRGDSNRQELYIIGGGLISALLLICSIISIYSDELSELLFNSNIEEISRYVSYLIFIPPVVAASNIFGLQILLPLGEIKKFRNTYIVSSMLGVISMFFGLKFLGVENLPFIILLTEISVLLQFFYYSLPFLRRRF